MSLETSLAEAEGVGLTLPGGKLVDSLRCFPARHSLGVARTRLEDHFPEPLGLGRRSPRSSARTARLRRVR